MKFLGLSDDSTVNASPPMRGAWIEMPHSAALCRMISVAPHAGGVD